MVLLLMLNVAFMLSHYPSDTLYLRQLEEDSEANCGFLLSFSASCILSAPRDNVPRSVVFRWRLASFGPRRVS